MKKTKHEISLTPYQAGEVLAPIIGVVLGMKSEKAQYWIGRKKKLAVEMRKILIGDINPYADLISDWEKFYRDSFGIEADFSNLHIPEKQNGFDRLIVMVQGMTSQRLYDKCKGLFPCWKWTGDNLDKTVISERTAKDGSYAIWVRNSIEADEELKSLSYNDIKERKIITEILEERLVHELKFFQETGNHLDIRNVTLCADSRDDDGRVPYVGWLGHYGGMDMDWCDAGDASDDLRSRRVVS